ncbi:MAG: rhamnan synthesis F family protein [Alphaproteobacteria bacterium]|nr:rhamnan synthesis F family protein [Alphaproteobacteria bacterium]
MTKRLFIFAGYSATNRVDAALTYYVRALSELGDVVLYMDCDAPKSELKKLAPYTLYAGASRHREYDFGSYKRAYIWARDNLDIKKYDIMYLVNDSVFGPLMDLTPTFDQMESIDTPAFGLVGNLHHAHPHIQSWFVGLRKKIFTAPWFDEFMLSVKHVPDKGSVTILYEHGLSNLITKHGFNWRCLYNMPGRSVYNRVKHMFKIGVPFIKKVAFTRHNGCLGGQLHYVMRHCDKAARDAIMNGACDTWGTEYISKLMTRNPLRLMWRGITYAIPKIIKREI